MLSEVDFGGGDDEGDGEDGADECQQWKFAGLWHTDFLNGIGSYHFLLGEVGNDYYHAVVEGVGYDRQPQASAPHKQVAEPDAQKAAREESEELEVECAEQYAHKPNG